jgi:hypothetical protein
VYSAEVANALEAERHGQRHDAHHPLVESLSERQRLYETVTGYAAEEVRNRRAGDALEAYYRLAEAEGRADLIREALAELQAVIDRARDLQKRGVVGPEAAEAALRQWAKSRGDQVELDVVIDQLNGQLKEMDNLACDPETDYRIWPTDPLLVTGEDPDPGHCAAEGLARRADLNLLRSLSAGLDTRTLPVATQALSTVSTLLGGPAGGCKCLTDPAAKILPCLKNEAVETARGQVNALLQARERQAVQEITTAARLVAARRVEAGLASLRAELAAPDARRTRRRHGCACRPGATKPIGSRPLRAGGVGDSFASALGTRATSPGRYTPATPPRSSPSPFAPGVPATRAPRWRGGPVPGPR